jgi:hypothetical protein
MAGCLERSTRENAQACSASGASSLTTNGAAGLPGRRPVLAVSRASWAPMSKLYAKANGRSIEF